MVHTALYPSFDCSSTHLCLFLSDSLLSVFVVVEILAEGFCVIHVTYAAWQVGILMMAVYHEG